MRRMPWFRLYSEFAYDIKLRPLTKSQRYDVVVLLCLASESRERGTLLYDDADLAASLELPQDECAAFVLRLIRLEILQRNTSGYLAFVNWNKRQYNNPSDTPEQTRERKRRSRADQNDDDYLYADNENALSSEAGMPENATLSTMETPRSRPCHDHVTTPESRVQSPESRVQNPEGRGGGDSRVRAASAPPSQISILPRRDPTPQRQHAAIVQFTTRYHAAIGSEPTISRRNTPRLIGIYEQHDPAMYEQALTGYFGCLQGSDPWPRARGFDVHTFIDQFDHWAHGQPKVAAATESYAQQEERRLRALGVA